MIDFFRSFVFAFLGLSQALKAERNFRVLWLIALGLCLVNYFFDFGPDRQTLFLLLLFAVLALELLNCSIEKSCDSLGLNPHPLIKQAKDFAAGAVLLMAIASLLIFAIICEDSWPHIFAELLTDPWPYIGTALILLLNLPLCLAQKLRFFGLALPAAALIVHLMLIMNQSGFILFLVLGLVFHLSLFGSYFKRLS